MSNLIRLNVAPIKREAVYPVSSGSIIVPTHTTDPAPLPPCPPFLPATPQVEWENCLALFVIISGILIFGFGQDRRGHSPLMTNLRITTRAIARSVRAVKRRASSLVRIRRTRREERGLPVAADAPSLGARQQCEDFL